MLLKVLVAVERAVVRGLLARVLVFRAWGMLSNILATWTRLATYMHSACEVATVTGYVPSRGYDHMYVPCLSEASCLLRLRVTNLSLRLRLLSVDRQELAVHASPRPEDAGRRQQAYTHGADLTKGRRTTHTNHA